MLRAMDVRVVDGVDDHSHQAVWSEANTWKGDAFSHAPTRASIAVQRKRMQLFRVFDRSSRLKLKKKISH